MLVIEHAGISHILYQIRHDGTESVCRVDTYSEPSERGVATCFKCLMWHEIDLLARVTGSYY